MTRDCPSCGKKRDIRRFRPGSRRCFVCKKRSYRMSKVYDQRVEETIERVADKWNPANPVRSGEHVG